MTSRKFREDRANRMLKDLDMLRQGWEISSETRLTPRKKGKINC